MRWLPVLFVLGLLGSLVGGWFLVSGPELLPPTEPVAADAPTAADDPGPPVAATMTATAPAIDDEGTNQEALTDGRTAVAPATDPTHAPRVRVVRGTPPMPVADAEVFHLSEAQAERFLRTRKVPLPRLEWPAAFGRRLRTDADGIAQLPATPVPWLCAAQAGDEFAFAVVPPGNRTVTMPLLLDETVTVAATLASDKPAIGLPVALLQHSGEGEARVVWQGETAATGHAIVRHFQLVRENPAAVPPQERFAALALVPFPTLVVTEFVGRPAGREPVRLQLPPVGSVVVQLTDHRGTALLSPALVVVQGEWPQAPSQPFPFAMRLLSQRQNKPAGKEPVRVPFVGAGTLLRLSARFESDRRPAAAGPLMGPTLAGEIVQAPLPLAAQHVLLAGRLLLPDGAPVVSAVVPAALWRAEGDLAATNVHTTADGRFDLVLGARADAPEYWLELRHESVLTSGDTMPSVLGARAYVSRLVGGQRVELGDIVLGDVPALVSGIVVDDLAQPVAQAEVTSGTLIFEIELVSID